MNRYVVLPQVILDNGDSSIPIPVWQGIWQDIWERGRHRSVFYNGGIESFEDFARFMGDPAQALPVVVCDTDPVRPVLVAWLNGSLDGGAQAHFCGLGDRPSVEAAREVLRYWGTFPNLRVVIGIIPESNAVAQRYAAAAGFLPCGLIPRLCTMAYEGRVENGVVSTCVLPKEG